MESTCSIEGCDRPLSTKGYCKDHYERQRLGKDINVLVKSQYQSEDEIPHGTYRHNKFGCRCVVCKASMAAKDQRGREIRYMKLAQMKLESGCADCGYNEYACALEFDHVRGEKEFNLSRFQGRSWKRVLAEIEKCDVICANCHRVRTQTRNGGFLITMDDIKKWMEVNDG